jgi:hypothetical protein
MKKKLIVVFILVTSIIGCLYIFIPNILILKSNIVIPTTQKGLHRMLLDRENIAKWWPGNICNDSLFFNTHSYNIRDNNITLMPIQIENQEISINSSLFFITLKIDSIKLEWVGKTITSYNPIKRFITFRKVMKLNDDMNIILQKMQKHFSMPENIYGIAIHKTLVVDAILTTINSECKDYPSTTFIYSLVNKLTNYANAEKVKITGYPMLNIEKTDTSNYIVQVALPLEKLLPSRGAILQKQMVKNGNILVTETTGGSTKANEAFNQIINYANDYERNMPAIPFYSLITDRSKESDSTKWVTKIYCPVM